MSRYTEQQHRQVWHDGNSMRMKNVSDTPTKTVYRTMGLPWFCIFICGKLAGILGFASWSWWWIFLPWAPVITELLKFFFAK